MPRVCLFFLSVFILSPTRRRRSRNLSLVTHVALFFILHFLSSSVSLVHHSSSKRTLSIRDVPPSMKKSLLPHSPSRQIFRPSSSRGPRVIQSYSSLFLSLSLFLFRAYPFSVSSVFLRAPTRCGATRRGARRVFSLPLATCSFFRLGFLPLAKSTRPFSYNGDDRRLFVHFRAASRRTGPDVKEAQGGGAAPSPRRSRTVVT